jgi:ketosteroid isomerase-like protein
MLTARQVLDRTVTAWNASDEEEVVAMGDPDIELTASGGLDFKGSYGLRKWYRLWAEACPDRVVRYHNVVEAAGQAIGEGTFTGTHTGTLHLPMGDVPATGRHLKADYVAVLRVAGGKITYMRHYFDVMDLMIQLGLAGEAAAV